MSLFYLYIFYVALQGLPAGSNFAFGVLPKDTLTFNKQEEPGVGWPTWESVDSWEPQRETAMFLHIFYSSVYVSAFITAMTND